MSSPCSAEVTRPRRHDLDALRAVAMLLGILLHSLMSFLPGAAAVWPVQDAAANWPFAILLAAIHGWRMPLFFLISGYFTAMLWQQRGLQELLSNRARRIVLPLAAGMLTIVPLMGLTIFLLDGRLPSARGNGIFTAVVSNDLRSVNQYIEAGKDLNVRDNYGSTPLHVACFLGRVEAASMLLAADASRDARNNDGLTAAQLLDIDWQTTSAIGTALRLKLQQQELSLQREQIRALFFGETPLVVDEGVISAESSTEQFHAGRFDPFSTPVFHHLWFLWFLCWLVPLSVILKMIASAAGLSCISRSAADSSSYLLWLLAVTGFSLLLMGRGPESFGPATSLGLLPLPAVLLFYGVFFAFGMTEYEMPGGGLAGANRPFLCIGCSCFVLFPVALILRSNPSLAVRVLCCMCEAAYAWGMSLGLIGLFRKHFCCHDFRWRYLADSSYWLYFSHIPLVWLLQSAVSRSPLPALLKLACVCSLTTLLLLLQYHYTVRSTWLGAFLNGRKLPVIPLRQLFSRTSSRKQLLQTDEAGIRADNTDRE